MFLNESEKKHLPAGTVSSFEMSDFDEILWKISIKIDGRTYYARARARIVWEWRKQLFFLEIAKFFYRRPGTRLKRHVFWVPMRIRERKKIIIFLPAAKSRTIGCARLRAMATIASLTAALRGDWGTKQMPNLHDFLILL